MIVDDDAEGRLLSEMEFVVVDVEAIGSRSTPTRVIEIGACRVRGGEIVAEYETLLNPGLPLPRFIADLTGINSDMLRTAPQFTDIAEPWLGFIGDSVLVAHNSNFDFTLLNQEINRVFPGCRMRNPELCTVQLARRVFPISKIIASTRWLTTADSRSPTTSGRRRCARDGASALAPARRTRDLRRADTR